MNGEVIIFFLKWDDLKKIIETETRRRLGLINKGDNFEDYIEEVRELNMIQAHRGHHKTEKDLWCTISHFLKIENVYQRVSLIKRSKIKSRMFIIWCLYRAPCVFVNQQCTHGTNQGKGP